MKSAFDGAVLDLDGTVYRSGEPLPGAVTAVENLRKSGIRTLFFSNNPTKSRETYAERLSDIGIETQPQWVLSAGSVTTQYLLDEHPDESVFLIGAPGLKTQFETAGIDLTAEPTGADVLVVSWTDEFEYDDLVAGYRAIDAGATFYGTDPDRLVPAAEGLMPGSGAIINAVAGTAQQSPAKMLGKPSAEAQRAALETLDAAPERVLVVGDRLNTDIELGERAGMTTVLVRTGVTNDADLKSSEIQPDYLIDTLGDLGSVLDL